MIFLKNLTYIFSQDSILSSLIKLVILPSLPLSLILAISLDPTIWISSEIHHFYIELIAVILGSALSFYYILRYRVLRDRFSLFVGIGFFISVSIDMFHVIVSYALMENISFVKYFIPQTWFAGRLFLGAMLLIAILKYSSLSQREEIGRLSDINPLSNTPEEVTENKNITEKKDGMIFLYIYSGDYCNCNSCILTLSGLSCICSGKLFGAQAIRNTSSNTILFSTVLLLPEKTLSKKRFGI